MPSTFGHARSRNTMSMPAEVPTGKGSRRDNRDHRHNRFEDDNDMGFGRDKQKKRGKRFRVNEGSGLDQAPVEHEATAPKHYSTPGSENLGAGAFDGLSL